MKKKGNSKVSIITVSYNNIDTIEDTVQSVLSQTYQNLEYIVIDACSNDGTKDILEKYKNSIDHVIIENDKGMYDGLNKGIKASTGDIIGILHSDDVYKDSFVIEKIIDTFKTNTNSDICLSDIAFFNGKPEDPKVLRKMSAKSFHPWQLKFGWMPPHPGMFVKKNLFEKIGFYSLSFKIAADYEFSLRAFLNKEVKYHKANVCSVLMREGGASTKDYKSNLLISKEMRLACDMNNIYTNDLFLFSRLPIKLIFKIIDQAFVSLNKY